MHFECSYMESLRVQQSIFTYKQIFRRWQIFWIRSLLMSKGRVNEDRMQDLSWTRTYNKLHPSLCYMALKKESLARRRDNFPACFDEKESRVGVWLFGFLLDLEGGPRQNEAMKDWKTRELGRGRGIKQVDCLPGLTWVGDYLLKPGRWSPILREKHIAPFFRWVIALGRSGHSASSARVGSCESGKMCCSCWVNACSIWTFAYSLPDGAVMGSPQGLVTPSVDFLMRIIFNLLQAKPPYG